MAADINTEAEEYRIPGEVRDQLKLVERDISRRVPEFEVDFLSVYMNRLGKHFVLGLLMNLRWILLVSDDASFIYITALSSWERG